MKNKTIREILEGFRIACASDCGQFREGIDSYTDRAEQEIKALMDEGEIEAFLLWYIGIEIAEDRSIDMHTNDARERLAHALKQWWEEK